MAALAANRNFRLIFSATAISNLGDGVSALAFPWLATLITRDPTLVAFVAFAGQLPWLLLTLPAGVITDRRDRRALMVQADVFRLLLTLGILSVILSAGSFPLEGEPLGYIAALSALAFLMGSAEVVRDNSAQTLLPTVVEKPQLERANGLLWSVEQVMGSFVGPPLAGLLIAWAVPAPFVLDAVTFGLAAWIVWALQLPKRAPPPRRSAWEEAREGVAWMRAHTAILRLSVMLGIMNALHVATLTVLVLFSQEALGLSAAGHGLMLTAGAAGGVAGGLLCPAIAQRLGPRISLLTALALMVGPYLILATTQAPFVAGFALFLEMFAALLWNVVTVSYRQRLIPDVLLGRVNSIYRFFGWGMMPLGALASGWAVALVEPVYGRDAGLRAVFWISGTGMAAMLAYASAKLRLPLADRRNWAEGRRN